LLGFFSAYLKLYQVNGQCILSARLPVSRDLNV
jgi:hypothetical protein